jgi:hypothetical protein
MKERDQMSKTNSIPAFVKAEGKDTYMKNPAIQPDGTVDPDIIKEQKIKEKARESKARRALAKDNLILNKSRARNWTLDNQGGYMIADLYTNGVVFGSRFDLSLEEVENLVEEMKLQDCGEDE